ncbi:acyltransferase [bacterium]|nr:MAG: acyltransferase [bacterium]
MTNDRIKYIDGLRALAVLSVVVFHAAKYDPGITHASSSLASFLLRQGCRGVDLFFVISGFCLAYPTLARLHERNEATLDIVRYSARRLARIVPPYYAAILLLLGLALLLRGLGITLISHGLRVHSSVRSIEHGLHQHR